MKFPGVDEDLPDEIHQQISVAYKDAKADWGRGWELLSSDQKRNALQNRVMSVISGCKIYAKDAGIYTTQLAVASFQAEVE